MSGAINSAASGIGNALNNVGQFESKLGLNTPLSRNYLMKQMMGNNGNNSNVGPNPQRDVPGKTPDMTKYTSTDPTQLFKNWMQLMQQPTGAATKNAAGTTSVNQPTQTNSPLSLIPTGVNLGSSGADSSGSGQYTLGPNALNSLKYSPAQMASDPNNFTLSSFLQQNTGGYNNPITGQNVGTSASPLAGSQALNNLQTIAKLTKGK